MQELTTKRSAQLLSIRENERFILKCINAEDMEISVSERAFILQALAGGENYIQIGRYTIMLSSISRIEPKNGKNNIPNRPEPRYSGAYERGSSGKALIRDENFNTKELEPDNKAAIDEWDRLYSTNSGQLQIDGGDTKE